MRLIWCVLKHFLPLQMLLPQDTNFVDGNGLFEGRICRVSHSHASRQMFDRNLDALLSMYSSISR